MHMQVSLESRVHFLRGLCWLLEAKKTCAKRGDLQKLEVLCFSLHMVFSMKYHSIIKRSRWKRTSGELSPNPAPSRATLTATICTTEAQVFHCLDLRNGSASQSSERSWVQNANRNRPGFIMIFFHSFF